jgi:hypothetical protein
MVDGSEATAQFPLWLLPSFFKFYSRRNAVRFPLSERRGVVKRQAVLVEQPFAARGERAINPGFARAGGGFGESGRPPNRPFGHFGRPWREALLRPPLGGARAASLPVAPQAGPKISPLRAPLVGMRG